MTTRHDDRPADRRMTDVHHDRRSTVAAQPRSSACTAPVSPLARSSARSRRRAVDPSAHRRRAQAERADIRPGARRLGADGPGDVQRPRLGPPTGTYYAIAVVVAVFVMLGLVMVLSASAVTEATRATRPYRIFSQPGDVGRPRPRRPGDRGTVPVPACGGRS